MDRTNAERQRRYRARQAAQETRRQNREEMDRFTNWLTLQMSETTVPTYVWRVKRIAWELVELGTSLNRATVDDLLTVWPDSGPDYSNGVRNALIAYYRWRGREDGAPACKVPKARKPKRLPRPLEADVVERYMSAAQDLGSRYYALACLGHYAGLRVREATRLRWSDVKGGRRLRVRQGKGARDREVPIAGPLREALDKWRPECPSDVWLFPPKVEYRPPHAGPVDYRTAWKWHQEVLHAAGLYTGEAYSDGFHRLRHTFGSTAYARTKDLRRVQKWLGHESPTTTALYTLVVDEGDEEAMRDVFGP